MPITDVYRITNQLDDPTLQVLVTRLEARAKHPRVVAMIDQYLDAMHIDAMSNVLDLGCGSGVVARKIVRRAAFRGKVLGVDLSDYLIRAAQRLSREEGVEEKLEFRAGDSHSLKLPDAAFDAVIPHTLVSHVDDPSAVLAEIARVLRPGGVATIFDGDYASISFANEDAAQAQRDDAAIIAAVATQTRVMRQMPALLRNAGLRLEQSFSHVLVDIGKVDYWAPAIESFRKLLPKSGGMSDAQANAWADTMLERSARGVFFGGCNFYTYIARRSV